MTQQSEGRGFITALGALLALAVFLYIALHVGWILREPDLWWHIRTGQLTLQNWAVPHADPFSYTQAGQPWIAKEWLSQVIFAVAYDVAGWAGPLLITALVIGFTGWLIYFQVSKSIQPVFAAVVAMVAIFLSQGVIVARPHVFTFPIMVFFCVICFDAARARTAPPWWSLLLVVLWTNLHGSFAIAFVIAGCAFLDYCERSRFSDRATLLKWIAYGLIAALVTLINPYFVTPYLIAFTLIGGVNVMSYISEWAAFTAPNNPVLEAGFMLVFLILLKVRAKFTFGQIFFTLMAFHMMLTHLRFIYVFMLAVPVVLMPDIAEAVPSASRDTWLERARDGLERAIGQWVRLVAGLAVLAVVGTSGFLLMKDQVVPPEEVSLTGALAYVAQHKASDPALQMRGFNDLNYGGPLILAGIPTYIDDRAEQLYIGPFLDDYLKTMAPDGQATLSKILAQPEIGWAILPVNDLRMEFLRQMPGWVQVYADGMAAIWERKT